MSRERKAPTLELLDEVCYLPMIVLLSVGADRPSFRATRTPEAVALQIDNDRGSIGVAGDTLWIIAEPPELYSTSRR